MEDSFKAMDAYEKEYVGRHEGHEGDPDGIMYCQDSTYLLLLLNGLLDISSKL